MGNERVPGVPGSPVSEPVLGVRSWFVSDVVRTGSRLGTRRCVRDEGSAAFDSQGMRRFLNSWEFGFWGKREGLVGRREDARESKQASILVLFPFLFMEL